MTHAGNKKRLWHIIRRNKSLNTRVMDLGEISYELVTWVKARLSGGIVW
jgi:hypothetical protein